MRAQGAEKTPGRSTESSALRQATAVAPASAAFDAGDMSPQSIVALQRSIGNAAVSRMIEESRHQHGSGCGHGQAAAEAAAPVQRSAVHDVLSSGGSPLDKATRTDMESRLGADFSDVRVHTGATAQRSAADIGARAYTSGSHVVIGNGGADKHTLAHELTHVIQQRQGPVAGTDNGSGLSVSDPSDRFEHAAEANARRVMSGPAPDRPLAPESTAAASAPGVVQRSPGGPDRAKPYDRPQGPTTTSAGPSDSPVPPFTSSANVTYIGDRSGLVKNKLSDSNTLAVNVEHSGDMYHLRAAMVTSTPCNLLFFGATPAMRRKTQGLVELVEDLAANDHKLFWSDKTAKAIGLTVDVDSNSRRSLGRKGDTASTRYFTNDLQNPGNPYGYAGANDLEREGKRKEFHDAYAKPSDELAAAFAQSPEVSRFQRNVPYVLVNFRDSGHSAEGNHPALDTGKEGMQQIVEAVHRALSDNVQVVPIGGFPGNITAETWAPRPHLVEYWNWAVTRDRRSQLALLHYLNANCKIIGAIGMRSGVTDQFALAGIRTLSIDITPYQNHRDPQNDDMQKHPSKGWDRGMKMENAFGPDYGRVFLSDARNGDDQKNPAGWNGRFSEGEEGDMARLTNAIFFYFSQSTAAHFGWDAPEGEASWGNSRHGTHPLHKDSLLPWLVKGGMTANRQLAVLQQIYAQVKPSEVQDAAVKSAYTQVCAHHKLPVA